MMFNFKISTYFIVQFFNFFIYLALGLYLTYTLPSEFGSQESKLFCLRYLKCKRRNSDGYTDINEQMVRTSLNTDDLENVEKPNYEPAT